MDQIAWHMDTLIVGYCTLAIVADSVLLPVDSLLADGLMGGTWLICVVGPVD